MVSIPEYPALFQLIGTAYGGDGVSTFGLPNLQSRVAVGRGQRPGGSSYAPGTMAGAETAGITAKPWRRTGTA